MSNWKQALDNPFGDVTPCIPDDRTLLSGKLRTRTVYSFVPVAQGGSPNNVNSSALIIRPRPYFHIIRCAQTTPTSTLVRDISSSGGTLDSYSNAYAGGNFFPAATTLNGSAMVRCVAMGVTVTYQGTELNRAGRYTAGLIPVTRPSSTSGVTVQLSCLSTMVPTDSVVAADLNVLRQAMQQSVTKRISDEELKLVWKPGGIPSYQRSSSSTPVNQIVGGGSSVECEFINNPGQDGQAPGEMNLVLLVENDYVTTAATSGNAYQVRVDAHWEVIPDEQFGVVYPLTPSPYSPAALAQALNTIDRTTVEWSPRSFRQARPRARKAKGTRPQAVTPAVQPRQTYVVEPSGSSWKQDAYRITRDVAKMLEPAAKSTIANFLAGAVQRRTLAGPSRKAIGYK